MLKQPLFRRFLLGLLTGLALAVAGVSVPIAVGALTSAYAQVSDEFQEALEPYGQWRRDPRFGDVWVPTGLPPDWRPYQYGHWVYTDEWGWYWVSDDEEADWGWVAYHYGRWAFDRGVGWFWVPGDEWAPAWVNWRHGGEYVGWAPLPPDDLVDVYEAEPAYWMFVPGRYMTAPRLRTYFVPRERRSFILRSTRIVNRTLAVRGARLAVNPGISPAFIARVTRAPVTTFRVRPRVFASTQGVSGAVQVRREELRGGRPAGAPGGAGVPRGRVGAISVQRTTTVIQPAAAATAPAALGKDERGGRLGTHPPRAAQGSGAPQPQQTPVQTPAQSPGPPAGPPPRSGPPPTGAPATPPAPPPAVAPARPEPPRSGPAPTTAPAAPSTPPQVRPERPITPQTPPPPPAQLQPRQLPPAQTAPKQPAPPPPPAARPPAPPPPPPAAARPPAPPPPAARAPAPPPPPPKQAVPPPPPPAAQKKGPPLKPGEKPAEVPK